MQQLGDAYPETLTIIRSANEIDRFMQKVGNNVEMKGPFNNGDKGMFNVMEEALSAGRQVAVQAFGPDKLLVIIGKPSSGARFIATAVFGSPFATEVVVFRQFRDEVLLRSKIGTAFVLLYYRVAPPLSLVIASSELLRAVSCGDAPQSEDAPALVLSLLNPMIGYGHFKLWCWTLTSRSGSTLYAYLG